MPGKKTFKTKEQLDEYVKERWERMTPGQQAKVRRLTAQIKKINKACDDCVKRQDELNERQYELYDQLADIYLVKRTDLWDLLS